LKSLVPGFLVRAYHKKRRAQESKRNAGRTPQEVFSEIYREKKWGDSGAFCSGSGSANDSIVRPYVAKIGQCLRSWGAQKPRVVDLGCGDFSVGSQLIEDCREYVGVDVVPELVRHLQANVGSARVRFVCLDIVQDDLPAGDVCLVRQVFQHLSNAQIAKVLTKLGRYRTVFITEHYPEDGPAVVPNLDKVHGSGIRLYEASGVYLDRPPFDVFPFDLTLELEVPGHAMGALYPPGVIRTYRLDVRRPA
jgi:SAM-dependent methyltransferase